MKTKIFLIIFIILSIAYIFFLWNKINVLKNENLMSLQNELALQDSLKTIKTEYSVLYHKYIKINASLNEELNKLNLPKKEKKLIQKTTSTFTVQIDTVKTNLDSINTGVYYFSKYTPFYSYQGLFKIPDYHEFSIKFNPITLKNYITQDKNGIVSSYIEVPDSLKEYLTISNLDVVFNSEFYSPKSEKSIQIYPNLSYNSYTKEFLGGVLVGYNNIIFSSLFNKNNLIVGISLLIVSGW